jgi:hypothetical protein
VNDYDFWAGLVDWIKDKLLDNDKSENQALVIQRPERMNGIGELSEKQF